MRKLKQILAIAMVVMMGVVFMPMMPAVNAVASADTAWTKIGESDCRYKIETTGEGKSQEVTLTIAPAEGKDSGTLPSYDFTGWPWYDSMGTKAGSITKVVIEGTVNGGEQLTGIFNNFKKCKTIDGLSNLKTTDVKKMNMMFLHCNSLKTIDVSGFDTSNATIMSDMFNGCSSLTELDVSNFSTNSVYSMEQMFQNCSELTSLDLSDFNTGNVTTMESMFKDCNKLASLDLTSFSTEKVTYMSSMFFNCSALTSIDLSSFNTVKVGNIHDMFGKCGALTTIFVSDDFKLTGIDEHELEMTRMFNNCTSLKGGAGTTYDPKKVNATYAHIDGGKSNPGYFTQGYRASFDVQGHGEAPKSQIVKIGDKLTKPNNPKAEGYTFEGWYKEASNKTKWDFDKDIVTEDTTLYAKWSNSLVGDVDQLKEDVEKVTSDITELTAIVAATEKAIEDANKNIKENKTLIEQYKKDLDAEIANREAAEKKLSEAIAAGDKTLEDAIKKEVEERTAAIKTITDRIDTAEASIKENAAAIEQANKDIESLETSIAEAEKKLTELEGEIDSLSETVEGHSEEITSLKKQVEENKAALNTLNTVTVPELKSSIKTISFQISDLQKDVVNLYIKIGDVLKESKEYTDAKVKELQNEIDRLNNKIDEMANEIATMKFEAKTVKIKGVKASKKAITVTIKHVSDADEYCVYYKDRTAKSAKAKYAYSEETTIKIKDLKKNHKYTIKVKAKKLIGGNNVSSKWSKSKTVKVK